MPGFVGIYQFYHWMTEEGRKDLQGDIACFDSKQTGEDGFTVHVSFDATHHLRHDEGSGGGHYGVGIYTNRAALSRFAQELRFEYLDCQKHRKTPPSADDTAWRMIH